MRPSGMSVKELTMIPALVRAPVALLLAAAILPGCGTVHVIQGIRPGTPVVELNKPVDFIVSGAGGCELRIDFGDGSPLVQGYWDLSNNPHFAHTFERWRGGKTVTVEAVSGCEGKVNTRVTTQPAVYTIGVNYSQPPKPPICVAALDPFPWSLPGVRSLIHVTTLLLSAAPRGIDFGCPVGGCIYDADGKNYPADSRFPFPGFKEYSLVLRLGTQVEQGGTDVRFTTTSSASLEICLNDDDIARTRRGGGGYEIHIQVDQLGP